jgi:hypothetical protein
MSSTLPAVHLRAGARLQAGSGSSRRVCRLDPGRVGASAGWVRVESARLQAGSGSSRRVCRRRSCPVGRASWAGYENRGLTDRPGPRERPRPVTTTGQGAHRSRIGALLNRCPRPCRLPAAARDRQQPRSAPRPSSVWPLDEIRGCGWAGWAGSGPADGPAGRALGLRMGRLGGVGACGWADSAGFVLLHRPAGAERARRYRPG